MCVCVCMCVCVHLLYINNKYYTIKTHGINIKKNSFNVAPCMLPHLL